MELEETTITQSPGSLYACGQADNYRSYYIDEKSDPDFNGILELFPHNKKRL